MTQFIETLVGIFQSSGFAKFGEPGGWLYAVMICVGCFLLYLAIVKEFEPLILLPMAFGMILANLPGSGVIHMQYFVGDGLEHPMWVEILNNAALDQIALLRGEAGGDDVIDLAGHTAQVAGQLVALDLRRPVGLLEQLQDVICHAVADPHQPRLLCL